MQCRLYQYVVFCKFPTGVRWWRRWDSFPPQKLFDEVLQSSLSHSLLSLLELDEGTRWSDRSIVIDDGFRKHELWLLVSPLPSLRCGRTTTTKQSTNCYRLRYTGSCWLAQEPSHRFFDVKLDSVKCGDHQNVIIFRGKDGAKFEARRLFFWNDGISNGIEFSLKLRFSLRRWDRSFSGKEFITSGWNFIRLSQYLEGGDISGLKHGRWYWRVGYWWLCGWTHCWLLK